MSMSQNDWTKSSYSNPNGDCTEVRSSLGKADVRDSKRPASGHISFPGQVWATFLGDLVKDHR
ncbi:DUF397 domain-containing protein [Yinghuangia aomiensis]